MVRLGSDSQGLATGRSTGGNFKAREHALTTRDEADEAWAYAVGERGEAGED